MGPAAGFDPPRPWPPEDRPDAPPPPADVVVVSDFRPGRAETFVPRTLLFLAAWIDNAGAARDWPLHLVTIGEPPDAVRRLAARAGARLTRAEPWPYEGRGTMNKLRGLQVRGETDRVLLLDADVVVLDDPSAVTTLGDGLALAPCVVPRVPLELWQALFSAAGLPLPAERIPCVQAELGGPPTHKPLYPAQIAEMGAMLPYYNAGIVLAPWGAGLLETWDGYVHLVHEVLGEERWLKVVDGDQTALVLAVQALRAAGLGLARLPYELHAHDAVVFAGARRARELKLFHAFGLFRRLAERGLDAEAGWHAYRRRLFRFYAEHGWCRAEPGIADPVEEQLRKLFRRLRRPWRQHVEPLLGTPPPRSPRRAAPAGPRADGDEDA